MCSGLKTRWAQFFSSESQNHDKKSICKSQHLRHLDRYPRLHAANQL